MHTHVLCSGVCGLSYVDARSWFVLLQTTFGSALRSKARLSFRGRLDSTGSDRHMNGSKRSMNTVREKLVSMLHVLHETLLSLVTHFTQSSLASLSIIPATLEFIVYFNHVL